MRPATIQDNGDAARQTLFDTGANTIGEGLATLFTPGITWEVGPYRLRAMGAWAQAEDGNFTAARLLALRGKKRGKDWLIGHDLYLWSPKGFLTGSANTPGSILVGTHFERTDVVAILRDVTAGDQRRSVPPRDLHHQRVGSVVLHRAANEHRWECAVVRCFKPDHDRTEKPRD